MNTIYIYIYSLKYISHKTVGANQGGIYTVGPKRKFTNHTLVNHNDIEKYTKVQASPAHFANTIVQVQMTVHTKTVDIYIVYTPEVHVVF